MGAAPSLSLDNGGTPVAELTDDGVVGWSVGDDPGHLGEASGRETAYGPEFSVLVIM
jgi:hypothetical protein